MWYTASAAVPDREKKEVAMTEEQMIKIERRFNWLPYVAAIGAPLLLLIAALA